MVILKGPVLKKHFNKRRNKTLKVALTDAMKHYVYKHQMLCKTYLVQ
jgi:hypothetical protein